MSALIDSSSALTTALPLSARGARLVARSRRDAPTLPRRGPASGEPLCADLREAASAFAVGERILARRLVDDVARRARLDGAPAERIAALFARALRARFDGDRSGTGNLYDLGAGPSEMLAAFRALVDDTPIIRFGHLGANEIIARAAADREEITVIDVGVGHGTQWLGLLDRLASSPSRAPRVTLVGVEVPEPGVDPQRQLAAVEQRLSAHAAARGISFRFRGMCARIEDVTDLGVGPADEVIINASFALHHVPAGDAVTDRARSRDGVLERLRELRPRALVLAEPHLEHNALDFAERVEESMHHYALVFDILATLRVAPGPRRIIEQAFFGREIMNIVTGEGPARQERHEHIGSWQSRLARLGFAPLSTSGVSARVAPQLGVGAPLAVDDQAGATVLSWRGEPMTAVMAWTAA